MRSCSNLTREGFKMFITKKNHKLDSYPFTFLGRSSIISSCSKKIVSLFLFFAFFGKVYALVEYSDDIPIPRKNNIKKATTVTKKVAPTQKPSRAINYNPFFQFKSSYESSKIKSNESSGKLDMYRFGLFWQLPVDLFMEARYWIGKTDHTFISEDSGYQQGNPQIILGLNWMKFGPPEEETRVDIYLGGSFKSSSQLASSRNDKIVGVQTSKRLMDFHLGVGYELHLTGMPKDSNEVTIGNINKLSVALAWRASDNITFMVEGNHYKVTKNKHSEGDLKNGATFGTITPSLSLGLSPHVDFILGSHLITNSMPEKESFFRAKLWQLEGVYGNSLFTRLDINI